MSKDTIDVLQVLCIPPSSSQVYKYTTQHAVWVWFRLEVKLLGWAFIRALRCFSFCAVYVLSIIPDNGTVCYICLFSIGLLY